MSIAKPSPAVIPSDLLGTSCRDPVRSHKLNTLGQLKLRCCQISSAKWVWDESVLEQETWNEQVCFKGHIGCGNTMYVHNVPFSFVKELIAGRSPAFPYVTLLKDSAYE